MAAKDIDLEKVLNEELGKILLCFTQSLSIQHCYGDVDINKDYSDIKSILKPIWHEWEDIAGVLGLVENTGVINHNHRGDAKDSMGAVLDKWMQGNGVKASYKSLLNKLEEAGLASEDIKTAIMDKVKEKEKKRHTPS